MTGGLTRYRVGLFSDITEKKNSEQAVWLQANNDALTNLPNRRLFRDRLAQDIARAARAQTNRSPCSSSTSTISSRSTMCSATTPAMPC